MDPTPIMVRMFSIVGFPLTFFASANASTMALSWMSDLSSTATGVAYIVGSVIDVNDVPVLSSEFGRSIVGETSVN